MRWKTIVWTLKQFFHFKLVIAANKIPILRWVKIKWEKICEKIFRAGKIWEEFLFSYFFRTFSSLCLLRFRLEIFIQQNWIDWLTANVTLVHISFDIVLFYDYVSLLLIFSFFLSNLAKRSSSIQCIIAIIIISKCFAYHLRCRVTFSRKYFHYYCSRFKLNVIFYIALSVCCVCPIVCSLCSK